MIPRISPKGASRKPPKHPSNTLTIPSTIDAIAIPLFGLTDWGARVPERSYLPAGSNAGAYASPEFPSGPPQRLQAGSVAQFVRLHRGHRMLFIVGKVYLKKKRQAFVSDPPASVR
jgi:hypothetical protein